MPFIPMLWIGLGVLTLGGIGGFVLSEGMKNLMNILLLTALAYGAYHLRAL